MSRTWYWFFSELPAVGSVIEHGPYASPNGPKGADAARCRALDRAAPDTTISDTYKRQVQPAGEDGPDRTLWYCMWCVSFGLGRVAHLKHVRAAHPDVFVSTLDEMMAHRFAKAEH